MASISVILPVYNMEKYLKESLKSIVNQTFEDIEIICINDGSTDNSLNILNDFAGTDSRIKIITQKNSGLGASRNVGIENAGGKYVYFIDSDDYLENTALEELYRISEKKNLDLLIFKLVNFDDETQKKDYTYSDMPFLTKFDDTFNFRDITDDLLKIDVTVYTKFFKRELLESLRFDENLIFEDNLFFIDYIFNAERVYFYDKCLYYRRVRNSSIIESKSRDYVDVIEIFNKSIEKVKEFGYYDDYKELLFMRKVDAIYYRYGLINPQYKHYFFELIKKDFTSKNDEYKRELDFKKIDSKSKAIFESGLTSNTFEEFELKIRNHDLKTRIASLKKENKKLKRKNNTSASRNQGKLFKSLDKIKRSLK